MKINNGIKFTYLVGVHLSEVGYSLINKIDPSKMTIGE